VIKTDNIEKILNQHFSIDAMSNFRVGPDTFSSPSLMMAEQADASA